MPELTLKRISYREYKEQPIEYKDDRYGIASFFTERIRQTFLACPGIKDESDCAAILLLDGDIVVGREIRFGTRLKIENEIVWVHTGCCLMVCEEYQKIGAGILLLTANTNSDDIVVFGAYYSTMRVKLMKKQKRALFEIPQYMKLINTRMVIENYLGLKGGFLSVTSSLSNALLRILDLPNWLTRRKLLKKYTVKKETIVPEWAGEMATNDGHKFMEYHDTKWLQWNLDYNMNGFPEDIQSFYAVYDRKGKPQGFFMTKERFEEEAGKWKNIIRGTIVEWATADSNDLTEADLNLLAISTFSRHTSHITTISNDTITGERLRKMGFKPHGTFQMSFKDKIGKYADGADISNWRVRYGCSNSIIF